MSTFMIHWIFPNTQCIERNVFFLLFALQAIFPMFNGMSTPDGSLNAEI